MSNKTEILAPLFRLETQIHFVSFSFVIGLGWEARIENTSFKHSMSMK